VKAGIVTAGQAEFLREAVAQRRNILVAGGTSTGKTTLVNALLAEVAGTADRIILIEDTRELKCSAPNLVALRTKDGVASLSDLVRSSLRLRLDRIPVGEVRGSEALELLKAWGTGHPGGIGPVHAGSATGALHRLEQLIQEVVVTVPRALIAETINVIAVLARRGTGRRLIELAAVKGLKPGGGYLLAQAVKRNGNGGRSDADDGARPHQNYRLTGSRRSVCGDGPGARRRLQHALGAAAPADPAVDRGAGHQGRRSDRHHHDRAVAAMLFVIAFIVSASCIALAGHFGLWLSERPRRPRARQ
jgi:hypothetical protein